MAKTTSRARKKNQPDIVLHDKIYPLIALLTAALLLVPYIAMQFSSDVHWSVSDFVIMGILLFGFSSGFVFASRKISKQRRLLIGLLFVAVFMYVWAELAVGVFFHFGG